MVPKYDHNPTLLIPVESSKSNQFKWYMNKGQFKDSLTSTSQVGSVGWALDLWTSDHHVDPESVY